MALFGGRSFRIRASRCRSAGLATQLFFVRYSDGLPHIRLRVFGEPRVLTSVVRPLITTLVNDCAKGTAVAMSEDHADEHGMDDLRWISYESETERYGGTAALMTAAENVFCVSSRVAVDLLPRYSGMARVGRVSDAALLMLVTLATFWPDQVEASRVAASYGTGYTARLIELGAPGTMLDRFERHVAASEHTILGIRHTEAGHRRRHITAVGCPQVRRRATKSSR